MKLPVHDTMLGEALSEFRAVYVGLWLATAVLMVLEAIGGIALLVVRPSEPTSE